MARGRISPARPASVKNPWETPMRVLLISLLLLAGCSAAPSDKVMDKWASVVGKFGEDKASWCFYDSFQGWGATVTHSYYRIGEGQTVTCNNHQLQAVPQSPGNPGGTVVSPNGDVFLRPQPRVFQQNQPTYRELAPTK